MSNPILRDYYVRERHRENILRKGLRRGSRILLSVLHLLTELQGWKIINTTEKILGGRQNWV